MTPKALKIEVDGWIPSGMGLLAERSTAAEISITLGDHCATEVEDLEAKSIRRTIRVSGETLAKWLLANWWRLRWEPERIDPTRSIEWAMAHSVAAAGNGYAWPDLRFLGSDGDAIRVEMKPYDNPLPTAPIRYIRAFTTTVTNASFENAVADFVDRILARLSACNIRASELLTLWNDIQHERESPKTALFRKFEALMGLDPDEDESLISRLRKSAVQLGIPALEEIIAGSNRSQVIADLDQVRKLAKTVTTFADMSSIGMAESRALNNTAPWRQGQDAATALRSAWNIGEEPVTNAQMADILQIPSTKFDEHKVNAPFSFGVRGAQTDKMAFVLNRSHPQGRRFDAARLLGDYIYAEDGRILPATGSTTARQKFQRAFAAEFLCPSRLIEERMQNSPEPRSFSEIIDDVAAKYDVSEQIVRHHMENSDLLTNDRGHDGLVFA